MTWKKLKKMAESWVNQPLALETDFLKFHKFFLYLSCHLWRLGQKFILPSRYKIMYSMGKIVPRAYNKQPSQPIYETLGFASSKWRLYR